MTTTVTRIKKSDTKVPGTLAKANLLLGDLGRTQDEINEISRTLDADISRLKAEAAKKLAPLAKVRDRQVNALFAYADARKVELTAEKRSLTLPLGTFGWRKTTPSVESRLTDEEIIRVLRRNRLGEYIRVTEAVDRQKLLADRPNVLGLSYAQHDEFFVKPKQSCRKPKTLTHAIDR
jgi:phage host-nuclease inhibitor protein Gam